MKFKGPAWAWRYEHDSDVSWNGEDESYWEYFTIYDGNLNEVARCDDEETARLIVNFPLALEALRQLHDYVEDMHTAQYGSDWADESHPMSLARAAIAKALGETK